MKDKTKQQLIAELAEAHQKITEMENISSKYKKAEEKLKEIEARYRALFDTSPDPIVMYDLQGNYIMVNKQAASVYGVESPEMFMSKFKNIMDILDETGRTQALMRIDDLLKGREVPWNEYTFFIRDGNYLIGEVNSSIILDHNDKPTAIISIIHDITQRRILEEALRHNEQQLRQIIDLVPHMIFVKDWDGKYILANKAVANGYNKTVNELVGKYHSDFHQDAGELQHMLQDDREVMTKGETKFIPEEPYTDAQGNQRFLQTIKVPFNTVGEKQKAVLGVALDITELKRSQSELHHSNLLLEHAQEIAKIGYWEFNLQNNSVWASAAAHQIYGMSAHEWTIEEVQKIPLPEYRQALNEKMLALVQRGEKYDIEFKIRRLTDGAIVDIHSIAEYKASECKIFGIIQDITERKRAENELRESENRYRQLIEQAADGIFVTDADGRFLIVNSKACEMLGYTKDELHQHNILDTYPDELRDIGRQRLDHLYSGENLRFERLMKRKNGTVFLVEASASKLEDGRLQAIIHDITDRKQVEEEKRRLEIRLNQAQKMEAIGTLAGGIAHDFNNILSAIIGYAELAMNDVSDPTKARNELQGVLKAGDRAKSLVKQILTFSRKAETKHTLIALQDIIVESIKMMRSILPSTIEIRQNLLNYGLVMGDTTQINQVVMNLCTNAAHAMDETGGVLEVSLKRVTLQDVSRDLTLPPGPYLNLSVSDTGHGMTPDIIERIFDPYYTTKELGRGTGLGLSVVHGIVNNHGGTIICKSAPGKGSTFNVYLPEIESEHKEEKLFEENPLPTGTERILFIDDEAALVEIAEKMLTNLGYKVVIRTSSTDALKLFQEDPSRFDLVITDMTMPGMTGDKLAQNIIAVRQDLPIILCTGYSEHISEVKAKGIGIKEFMMKPLEMSELAKTIRKVLDGG